MGEVAIWDEEGNELWCGHNVITDQFRKHVVACFGSRRIAPPQFCAIGARYAGAIEDPWTRTVLESEMGRFQVSGSFVDPVSGRAVLITNVRTPNISAVWKEVALFDDISPLYDYGNRLSTSCDTLNSGKTEAWTTGTGGGTGNTLLADPNDVIDGVGTLRCFIPVATGDDRAFANSAAGFLPHVPYALFLDEAIRQGYYRLISANLANVSPSLMDQGRTRLQMFISLDTTQFGNLEIRLGNTGSSYHKWEIASSNLTEGINFIDLYFGSSPQITPVTYTAVSSPGFYVGLNEFEVRVVARVSADVNIGLDRIRLFEDRGQMLARAEIYPAFSKGRGAVSVSWIIDPFPNL